VTGSTVIDDHQQTPALRNICYDFSCTLVFLNLRVFIQEEPQQEKEEKNEIERHLVAAVKLPKIKVERHLVAAVKIAISEV